MFFNLVKQFSVTILLALLLCSHNSEAQTNPCSGVIIGNVPHPDNCFKFYTCVLQTPTERTCPVNEIFDVQRLECTPGNQETCETVTEPSTIVTETSATSIITEATTYSDVESSTVSITDSTTEKIPSTTNGIITTVTPRPNIPEICRDVFFGARPHPTSELLYVGCIRGNGIIYQCFEKEEFDPKINECVRICEVTEEVCYNTTGVAFVANPCNCISYVICFQQRIVSVYDCDEGKIFREGYQE